MIIYRKTQCMHGKPYTGSNHTYYFCFLCTPSNSWVYGNWRAALKMDQVNQVKFCPLYMANWIMCDTKFRNTQYGVQ